MDLTGAHGPAGPGTLDTVPDASSTDHAALIARLLREPPTCTVPELAAFLDAAPTRLRMERAMAARYLTSREGRAAATLAMHYVEQDFLDPRVALSVLLTAESGTAHGEPLDALRLTALFRPRATDLDSPHRSWHQRISRALRGWRRTDGQTTGGDAPAAIAPEQFEAAASVIDFTLRAEGAPNRVITQRDGMAYVTEADLKEFLSEGHYDPERVRAIADLVLADERNAAIPRLRRALDASRSGVAVPLADGWL